jgi:hypothetical protein
MGDWFLVIGLGLWGDGAIGSYLSFPYNHERIE